MQRLRYKVKIVQNLFKQQLLIGHLTNAKNLNTLNKTQLTKTNFIEKLYFDDDFVYPFMRIAICCAMNQNRSMETHALLSKKGYNVASFGTNSKIKIPGMSLDCPNVYPFTVTYKDIFDDLIAKNADFYRSNGLLHIIERNMLIKNKPENFFAAIKEGKKFDLVITCEERCFFAIYDSLELKKNDESDEGFWLVNFDIKDTPSDAILGANEILRFVSAIENDDIEKGIEKYYKQTRKELLFSFIKKY